jgi:hypothetical protein
MTDKAAIVEAIATLRLHRPNQLDQINSLEASLLHEGPRPTMLVRRKGAGKDSIRFRPEVVRLATIGDGVTVKESNDIKGEWGLFATRAFTMGELITEFSGRLMDYRDVPALASRSHIRTLTPLQWVLDGSRDENGGRIPRFDESKPKYVPRMGKGGAAFANDAHQTERRVNCEFFSIHGENADDPREHMVVLRATQDIPKGKEIMVEYGADYWINDAVQQHGSFSYNSESSTVRWTTIKVILTGKYHRGDASSALGMDVDEDFRYVGVVETVVIVNVRESDVAALSKTLARRGILSEVLELPENGMDEDV